MYKHNVLVLLAVSGWMVSSAAHAENYYTFGIATGIAPRYLGSKDHQGEVTPLFAANFSNGIFASNLDGVGYKKVFANGVFFSASVNYDFGRSDSDRSELPGSNYLRGMGSIPGSVILSLQGGATVFGATTISATIDQPITNTTRGVSGHLDVSQPLFQTTSDGVAISSSLHAGSSRYMQTFFGVTDLQAFSSGFRPYSVKAGFDSAAVSAAWTHTFTPRWSIRTSASYTHILGTSGNSPIVQSKSNFSVISALSYTY